MSHTFPASELIITPEQRLYHINLRAEDIADDVIVVGDPERVAHISKYFDKIDFTTQHREFITHTGWYKGKRLTVLSTGIGIGNIDIVVNELDAAVNIDLTKRELLPTHRSLNIIRLGTCGGLQADVPIDTLVASAYGIGMDGLLTFYEDFHSVNDDTLSEAFINHMNWPKSMAYPYACKVSPALLARFDGKVVTGITATASGFYGPQGRKIRLTPTISDINERLSSFSFEGNRILNFEMETSALYTLSALLGHNHLTVCTVIANRPAKKFSTDLAASVDKLVRTSLDCLAA